MWFGVTILFTGLAAGAIVGLLSGSAGAWRGQVDRATTFVGHRFAEVWDDPPARDHLAREAARELQLGIALHDAQGQPIARFGEACADGPVGEFEAPVMQQQRHRGTVRACLVEGTHPPGGAVILGLVVALMVLWGASGVIAWRLTQPLSRLVKVTQALGRGELDTRVERPGGDELGVVGRAFNDMADRIQQQLADQRELLAVVSHEIRTPLGHMRVLLDLAREGDGAALEEVEQELLEVDRLVDQLLASSRLEFDQVDARPLDAAQLAERALTRSELPTTRLELHTDALEVEGDANLLGRALANLVDNAQTHGQGLVALTVERDGDMLVFAAHDQGPGLPATHRERLFESFVRGGGGGKLGLGLALVQRIAAAHGGRAFADDRPGGGARVGFSLPAAGG